MTIDQLLYPTPREYTPTFLGTEQATAYFTSFQKHLAWQQYEIRMFGKTFLQPRMICFIGDRGVRYSYSKTHLVGEGRDDLLLNLKTSIEKTTGYSFNSVLCNLYRNGNDSMGRHADNEKELGPDPVIASVSLGAKRMFHLKHKSNQYKQKILLQHGSLLLMKQGTQTDRKHAIMKTRKIVGPRINLTFRNIVL